MSVVQFITCAHSCDENLHPRQKVKIFNLLGRYFNSMHASADRWSSIDFALVSRNFIAGWAASLKLKRCTKLHIKNILELQGKDSVHSLFQFHYLWFISSMKDSNFQYCILKVKENICIYTKASYIFLFYSYKLLSFLCFNVC